MYHEGYSHSELLMHIVVICNLVGGVNGDTGIGFGGLLSLWFV